MQESPKYELLLRYQGFGGSSAGQAQAPQRPALTDCFLPVGSAQGLHYRTAVISFPLKGIKSSNRL